MAIVLTVSPAVDDHVVLRRILASAGFEACPAHDLVQAFVALRRHRAPIVITECCLERQGWKDLLREVHSLPYRPAPRVIVASPVADNSLWAEALNLGCYDLLPKPFDPPTVMWVVTSAWLSWERECPAGRANRLVRAIASA